MRLSIITVNLNNKAGLERTLQSVFEQTYRDLESIVVDGLSTDGSRDVLAAFQGQIHKWVSEKDTGIFNAMNKGIRMAEGEYLLFLNSGDNFFSPDALAKVLRHPLTEDFVVCDIELVKQGGRELRALNQNPRDILILGEIFHQAVFHRKSVFDRCGLYDEDFPLMADYELFLRAFFRSGCTCQSIHETLAEYDHIYGMSSDIRNVQRYHAERRKAQRKNFDPELVAALETQHLQIEGLLQTKSKYDGLLQSKTVKMALAGSAMLRRVRQLLGCKTPGRSVA